MGETPTPPLRCPIDGGLWLFKEERRKGCESVRCVVGGFVPWLFSLFLVLRWVVRLRFLVLWLPWRLLVVARSLGCGLLPGLSLGGLRLCGLVRRGRLSRLRRLLVLALGCRSVRCGLAVLGGASRSLFSCAPSRWCPVGCLVCLFLSSCVWGGFGSRFFFCWWPVWLPFF